MFQKKDEMEDTPLNNDIKNLGVKDICIDTSRLPIKKKGKKPHNVLFSEEKYVIVNVTCRGGYKLD